MFILYQIAKICFGLWIFLFRMIFIDTHYPYNEKNITWDEQEKKDAERFSLILSIIGFIIYIVVIFIIL